MIYIQIIGCVVFLVSTFILGILLRKYPSGKAREATTLTLHFIAFLTFLLPILIGIFYPGLTSYDELLDIQSFRDSPLRVAFGAILIPIGIFFMAASNYTLFENGHGQAAFFLTKKVVKGKIYKLTRNPMSLGFYLGCLALGLLSGSTYFTLWVLLEIIPVHVFYLKFFEERELESRFGNPYVEYKERVPFLIPSFRYFTKQGTSNPNSKDISTSRRKGWYKKLFHP